MKQTILTRFKEKFTYRGHGQWMRNMDGYEDEDGTFVTKPHYAYMVPEDLEAFLEAHEQKVREKTLTMKQTIHKTEHKTDNYKTIIFGWLLQGMGGDTAENIKHARKLIEQAEQEVREKTLTVANPEKILSKVEKQLADHYGHYNYDAMEGAILFKNELIEALEQLRTPQKGENGK